MNRLALKRHHKTQRKKRARGNIMGNATVPRISVYRSNRHFYLQAINDHAGVTIASASTYEANYVSQIKNLNTNAEKIKVLGERLANRLIEKKILQAVYDCNGNQYHGNVRIIADSIRDTGVRL